MDQSNGLVMRIYPVEKHPEEMDITRCFVGLPAGTKPCGLVRTQHGLGVVAVVPRDAGMRVPHNLMAMAEDVLCIPLLGETIGEPFGTIQLGGPKDIVTICPLYPWPDAPNRADA